MKRFSLAPLLACLALGCGVDFSAPVVDTGANLTVHLELVDSLAVGQARLSGNLWPGFNASGGVRIQTDSSIEVWGRTIAPSTAYPGDSLRGIPYVEQWGLNPHIPAGEVVLRAPEIPGVGEPAPVLRLTPPWRAGTADVTVARGSGLRLDLAILPAAGDSVYESWRLDLVNGDGQFVGQISATGATPATIDIPWALLGTLGGSGTAHLVVQQAVRGATGSRYSAAFLVTTRHVWSLTVQP